MIDTHTHLNLSPLLDNYQEIWHEALDARVNKAITIGADLESSKSAVLIAGQLEGVYAAVGLHPDVVKHQNLSDNQIKALVVQIETLATHPKVVAIGECGLDYIGLAELSVDETRLEKNKQKLLFGLHIQLAKKLNLPLSIHCRNSKNPADSITQQSAYSDLIDTLEHFSMDDGMTPAFVLHCMSGDMDYLQNGLKLGGYISFAGNITYPNAENLRALLHQTPISRLLLETDAPFLSPQSSRGTPNSPAKIKETYEFVAKELNISIGKLVEQIGGNARKIFHLV